MTFQNIRSAIKISDEPWQRAFLLLKTLALRFQLALSGALIGGFCVGCVSTNPQKFSQQVQHWVPLGTPLAKAERIMSSHDFDCRLLTKDHPFNEYGVDCLDCDREQIDMHDWNVKFFLEDGKVSKYGPMSVDENAFERDSPGRQAQ